jgi:TPR repeat protein
MKPLSFLVLAVALLIGTVPVATAQDFDKGLEAAQSGDFQTALQEWSFLANNGDASAQANLGLLYENGDGVTQDYAQAVSWYRMAAQQGDADGQVWLGKMYFNGNGVTQDYAQALKWTRRAADQGYVEAQFQLGNLYAVRQSNIIAYMWYSVAFAQGYARAEALRLLVGLSFSDAEKLKLQDKALTCIGSNYQSCDL